MTRADVARALGITTSGLRHVERSGRIAFFVDAAGVHLFTPAAVEEARARVVARPRRELGPRGRSDPDQPRDGQLAARAFELLHQGAAVRDLVRQLEVTPADAAALASAYRAPSDVVLGVEVVEELRQLGAVDAAGAVTGPAVLAFVRRLRERLRLARRQGATPPGERFTCNSQAENLTDDDAP